MSFLLYQRQRSLGVLLHCGPVCCPFSGVHGYPAYLHLILIYSSHCDDIRAIPYVWVSKSSLFIYLFCMRSDDSDVIFLAIIIAGFKMPLKVKVDVGGILAHLSFSLLLSPSRLLLAFLPKSSSSHLLFNFPSQWLSRFFSHHRTRVWLSSIESRPAFVAIFVWAVRGRNLVLSRQRHSPRCMLAR